MSIKDGQTRKSGLARAGIKHNITTNQPLDPTNSLSLSRRENPNFSQAAATTTLFLPIQSLKLERNGRDFPIHIRISE
uniref:Uncharacterized protein n=1 Tax=Salix viminalis TaxID=40686 RepID=A0A6N2LRX6_SALVM